MNRDKEEKQLIEQKDQVIEILNSAKQILLENSWIKHGTATNSFGIECEPDSSLACYFSLSGSLQRAVIKSMNGEQNYILFDLSYYAVFKTIEKEFAETPIGEHYAIKVFNDWIAKNKDEIITILDRTVESLELIKE